jgi:hypothetical protein
MPAPVCNVRTSVHLAAPPCFLILGAGFACGSRPHPVPILDASSSCWVQALTSLHIGCRLCLLSCFFSYCPTITTADICARTYIHQLQYPGLSGTFNARPIVYD